MNDWKLKWEYFVNILIEKGAYKKVLEGLQNTLIIAFAALLIGIVIGTLIAVVKILPDKLKGSSVLKKIADVYVAFFRGTPLVVQLLVGYYVIFPILGIRLSPVVASTMIFGLNSGAYVSEIMRSGLLSVEFGQTEAGRALGLTYPTTLFKIVVPQAVKNILPTIGNELISLVKETSIVSFIGAVDLCTAFKNIGTANYEYMVPYCVMAVVYIVIVLIISLIIKLTEKRLRASDKR